MDHYFGKFGERTLASDTPIVVSDEETGQIFSLNSLEEAEKKTSGCRFLYIWSPQTGHWQQVDYIALYNKPGRAIGFKKSI
jgi:hypothetical protein